jgi:hypothetical protein
MPVAITHVKENRKNPEGRNYFFVDTMIMLAIYFYVYTMRNRVSLVEQDLLTLPEHLRSPLVLVGFVLLDH